MVWKPVGSASAWLPESDSPRSMPAAERPAVGRVRGGRGGAARQVATRALLWLVDCDEPSRYTFDQAAAMAQHGLADGISQLVHPFRSDLDKRLHRIKDDWRKSGEVAARASLTNRGRRIAVEEDDDREFRLH